MSEQNSQNESGTTTENGASSSNGAATSSFTKEFETAGNKLVDLVKNLIREGNARHLIIRQSNGAKLLEIPLTAGVGIGGVMVLGASWLVILGVIAAIVTKVKVEVVMDPEQDVASAEPMDVPIEHDGV